MQVALWLILLSPSSVAWSGPFRVLAHLGGAMVQEEADSIQADWNSGVADIALEYQLLGPVTLGAGAEFLIGDSPLDVGDRTAGFTYAKVRPPLIPLRPYLGVGVEWRKAGEYFFQTSEESQWYPGLVVLGGIGIKISRVSVDLEVRRIDTKVEGAMFRIWSLRPGATVWF